MASDARMVVVRRGHFATFELLARTFADDPTVQIIWDRRMGERRQTSRSHNGDERRRNDRRRPLPNQWSQLNYMITDERIA